MKKTDFLVPCFVTLLNSFIEDSLVVIMNMDLAFLTHCYFSDIFNGQQYHLWQKKSPFNQGSAQNKDDK